LVTTKINNRSIIISIFVYQICASSPLSPIQLTMAIVSSLMLSSLLHLDHSGVFLRPLCDCRRDRGSRAHLLWQGSWTCFGLALFPLFLFSFSYPLLGYGRIVIVLSLIRWWGASFLMLILAMSWGPLPFAPPWLDGFWVERGAVVLVFAFGWCLPRRPGAVIQSVRFFQYLFSLLIYWTFEIEHGWRANWLLLVLLFFHVSMCMSYWDQILSSCSLSFGLALAICHLYFTVFLDLHHLMLIFFLDESTLHAYSVVGHHLAAVIRDLLVPLATISSLPIVLDLFKPLL